MKVYTERFSRFSLKRPWDCQPDWVKRVKNKLEWENLKKFYLSVYSMLLKEEK